MDGGGVEGWGHAWVLKPERAKDHRVHRLPPPPPQQTLRRGLWVRTVAQPQPRGERAAAGRRRGVPRVAAGARVPRARTRTGTGPRAPASRPDRARATRGGKRVWAADVRRGRHRRGRRGGRETGNTAPKGRTANDRQTKTRSHPAIPVGPRPPGARPYPTPDTLGATTPKGRLQQEEALKGETDHRGLAARGVAATSRPLLPSRGQRPPGHRGRGHRVFT